MMEFVIIVDEKQYEGSFVSFGHGYKIVVFIGDIPVTFEPDEERNFHAIVPPGEAGNIDAGLLKKIAEELEINLE